tara:strand:+ start:220 stop:780 length:561 start_codon:yes stop_codon:yes gene_type:complete
MSNQLMIDGIIQIKNIFNDNISKLVKEFADEKANRKMETIGRKDFLSQRNVWGYHLLRHTPTDIWMYNLIRKEITRLYLYYKAKFPQTNNISIQQIDILKYTKGGFYKAHTDVGSVIPRQVSIIINLNDNFEGGEVFFWDQKQKNIIKEIKPFKNSVTFFPSNFLYPHSVEPVKKGVRYSIVSWLN